MVCISSAQYSQTAEETDLCLVSAGSYPKPRQSPPLAALPLPTEPASWHRLFGLCISPAADHQAAGVFSPQIKSIVPGAIQPWVPHPTSLLKGVLYSAASQHHHRSQHRQLASPSRSGHTLLRHQIAGPAPFLNTALE